MPRSKPIPVDTPRTGSTPLTVAIAVFGMTVTAVVLGTALYGPRENSERAFRLLEFPLLHRLMDRLGKNPETEAPEPSPSARRRTRPAAREEAAPLR